MIKKAHTILVVEDEPDIAFCLSDFLKDEGYNVDMASNGEEAFEYIKNQVQPCVILLDLFMPVMNGLDFIKKIITDEQIKLSSYHLPVILFSAAPPNSDLLIEAKSYCDRYLKKPARLTVILDSVSEFCKPNLDKTEPARYPDFKFHP